MLFFVLIGVGVLLIGFVIISAANERVTLIEPKNWVNFNFVTKYAKYRRLALNVFIQI